MANLDQVFSENASPNMDPIEVFREWFAAAGESEPNDPNTMCLATVGPGGMPSARMVLLKDFGPDGFTFYTNTDSAKGEELAKNAKAGLCFYWKSLRRQVRVQGTVSPVSGAEADAYFAGRPRGAQFSAWASEQSQPLASRAALEGAVAEAEARFGEGEVPRPPHWSGYRVAPDRIEFWLSQLSRRHDRMLFNRTAGGWQTQRLYP